MKNKPIKILFDAGPMVNGQKSGVGYYTQNLVVALANRYPDDIKLVGHYFNFFGRKKFNLPTSPNIFYTESKIIPGKLLSLTRKFGFQLPLELFFKQSGDAALFTNFVSLPSLTNIPKIVTVHDLGFLEVSEHVVQKNRDFLELFVPKSIEKAKLVLTISEFTKKAIIRNYSVDSGKIEITPIPPAPKITDEKYDLSKIGVTDKYILFVGNFEPRKNIINLVKAYMKLPSNMRSDVQLVLVGGAGWYMEATLKYIAKLQSQGEKILTPGYVTDECRAALYKSAAVFVLPSHYEGFGMPILEAASYGTPVAISDIEVFHEVAGDGAVYFDQNSPEDMAKKISNVLNNTKLRKKLSEASVKNLNRFSWDKTAEIAYKAIMSTLGL